MDRREFIGQAAVLLASLYLPVSAQGAIEPHEEENNCKSAMTIADYYKAGIEIDNPQYPVNTTHVKTEDLENMCSNFDVLDGNNNTGIPVKDKHWFISELKFNEDLRDIFREHNVQPEKLENLLGDLKVQKYDIRFYNRDEQSGYMLFYSNEQKDAYLVPTRPALLNSIKKIYK